jgi:LysM repeat protein
MRRLIFLLLLVVLLVSAVGVSAQTTFVNHTVARGETLAIIAARYGTTWQAIAQLNNLPNPNLIFAGQILVIPIGQVVPPPPPPPPPPPVGQTTPYHVTRGDTLARIAGYYGTTWQTLAGLNGLANPNLIFAGQRLLAPVNASRTAAYTVRRGDTLGTIASRFNSSVAAITARNGLVNPNLIFTGQFLAVPF